MLYLKREESMAAAYSLPEKGGKHGGGLFST